VTVYPGEGYAGQEFTFTGTEFTPNGLIHEGFTDPNQKYHYHNSFYADSSGGFVRVIVSEGDWPLGVYTYIAFDSAENFSASVQFEITGPSLTATPTLTSTPTPTPGLVVVVSPAEAPLGETFTFTGSGFTPDGSIESWFADPNQAQHGLGHFKADSTGGFTRRHNWTRDWPTGTYTYLAFDFATFFWTSVEFEMTDPLPTATVTVTPTASSSYEVYLPMVVKDY
jgi:hypothetical protein